MSGPDGVLLTGVFGSGKSAVAVEIAEVLEERGESYALLDLDHLGWYSAADDDGHAVQRLLLRNLHDVARNYVEAGVHRFVLARAIRDDADLAGVRAAVSFPVAVVRLTAPIAEIRRRLATEVTAARQADLREAGDWLAAGVGVGIEDVTVPNVGPVRAVAEDVLRRVHWV